MDLFASHRPDGDVGDPQVPGPGHTPPRVRAPRTGDGIALDDWDVPGPRPGSRRWLLLAAVVPWVVVVAVMVTGQRPAAPGSATGDPTPDVAATDAAPTDAATAGAPAPTPAVPTAVDTGGGATGAPGAPVVLDGTTGPNTLDHARGLAVLVARSWLSSRPPGPPIDGLDPGAGADERYVEHVVVESVDHPARGALVVTVRAVVLPVEGDRYGTAEQVRLAVPMALDADAARPAGTPWRLPVDTPVLHEPTTSPVDDPDLQLAAVEAVAASGYQEVDLVALARTSGWAWVADVTARAPGEEGRRDHRLWLRSDVGRLVVAGAPAPPPSAPPDAAASSPDPSPTDQETAP